MSLPPGFLDELRDRLSLSQVVGRKVMWDQRKSNPGKGDMWAPCPFHQEKTASFHVDDRKGYYYCFGCHAKGDAITFVREIGNVSFMEAVEILAGEAGMQMPVRDPHMQEKSDHRSRLVEVMECAVQFFRLQLRTGVATGARAYLARRGLTPDMLARWEIGFAPEGWQVLWDHLRGKSVKEELILAAGLARPGQKGGKPYDTFRNRIMFPIRDARGRAIAFGGRAMDPGDRAKYLNSPETGLFDKGRSLYNHGPARAASGKGQRLIVAEGYMDVIALSEAGFGATVAPLGTAVTEYQLELMWRIAEEPVIALDGDTAGLRAAFRLIDLALPLLEAGKTLRFALMPEGKDPDDLIRAEGPAAMQSLLDRAHPLVSLLWQHETDGKVFDSPERKAALDKVLSDKIRLIRDSSLRDHYAQYLERTYGVNIIKLPPPGGHYEQEINQLHRAPFAPPHRIPGGRRPHAPQNALASTRASRLATTDDPAETALRQSVILAVLITVPGALEKFEARLDEMVCADPDLEALRLALLHAATENRIPKDVIATTLGLETLENLLGQRHISVNPCLSRPDDLQLAQMTLTEEFFKLDAVRGLDVEIAEAVEELVEVEDESLTWRLNQATETRNRAIRSQFEDAAEYETGDNGTRINRQEREAFGSLLDRISYSKHQN